MGGRHRGWVEVGQPGSTNWGQAGIILLSGSQKAALPMDPIAASVVSLSTITGDDTVAEPLRSV